jgi:hypothetical protein
MLLEITTPPCRAHPVGAPVNVTFTVTNTGERTIAGVQVAFNIPDVRASFAGIQVTDPSGALSECLHKEGVADPCHAPLSVGPVYLATALYDDPAKNWTYIHIS